MIKIPLAQFFKDTMIRLGYHGWSLKIIADFSGGYCWINQKIIDVGDENTNPKELLIHEIAHISSCRFCNNKHHENFWRVYRDLMRRFLPSQKPKVGFNQNIGYFKKCYDNTDD